MSTPYLDEGPKYFKPLSLNDRLLIDTLTTRYESVEAPFIAIDRGEYVELRHTKTVRRKSYGETDIKTEAPEVLLGQRTSRGV